LTWYQHTQLTDTQLAAKQLLVGWSPRKKR
jgi:hypothetical protein